MTPEQELSEEQLAFIADRARVWEVRRFCQVLPSIVAYQRKDHDGRQRYFDYKPDGALAALLRCIVYQLGADLAMVSLLDDHTQYFVAGATRSNVQEAQVTLESTRWYGCETVIHHGGLCERTITQPNRPGNMAFYEVLDMSQHDPTKHLSFVQGDIANFRHYAGVPLSPYGGPNIGTVFFFSKTPSHSGRSAEVYSYLSESATYITRHLEQSVEALQGKRVLRFNQGVAALLKLDYASSMVLTPHQGVSSSSYVQHQPQKAESQADSIPKVYHAAAKILCNIFELDGVRIQEASSSQGGIKITDGIDTKTIAFHLGPDAEKLQTPSIILLDRLLESFPQGAAFQIISEADEVVAATGDNQVAIITDDIISEGLPRAFPKSGQVIFMPLWDTYHECNNGAVFGFALIQSKVYLGPSDLSAMSAFCTTIMTQVRRLEAKAMDRIKSDFLGSVSHEMRTPLHGILSSLELLNGNVNGEHQNDLLKAAHYSGMTLLEIVERVLSLSKISPGNRSPGRLTYKGPEGLQQSQAAGTPSSRSINSGLEEESVCVIQICERGLERATQKLRLKERVRPDLFASRQDMHRQLPTDESPEAPQGRRLSPVIVFDTNATWSYRPTIMAGFEIVFTNLLDNAVKFGDSSGCVRVSLRINETSIRLSITDTGKGVTADFVRHSIFSKFSQEDPLNEGTGLGLHLVKQTMAMLGGNIEIDSDGTRGSTFVATFPTDQTAPGSPRDAPDTPLNFVTPGMAELPHLALSIFGPRRWQTGDSVRGARCIEMVSDSITCGLDRWFDIDVTSSSTSSQNLRLLIVLFEDLEHVLHTIGGTEHQGSKLLVLCHDAELEQQMERDPAVDMMTVVGPLTSTKLEQVKNWLLSKKVSVRNLQSSGQNPPGVAEGQVQEFGNGPVSTGHTTIDIATESMATMKIEDQSRDLNASDSSTTDVVSDHKSPSLPRETQDMSEKSKEEVPDSSTVPSSGPSASTRQPKLLLVDDNSINLKIIGMYARKCSTLPHKIASGGQAAIDAYNEAFPRDGNTSEPYDIIFLDLSMPEVSGFEVATKIRETEEASGNGYRVAICALTGLASEKDRDRAFAAGVDDYLLKPANAESMQAIVEKWRKSLVE